MKAMKNSSGKAVLSKMVSAIQENKDYLGMIDGLIGDGDHGANMNKGFSMFADKIGGGQISFTEGLNKLGDILLTHIGGSMGPIYGTIFMKMAEAGSSCEEIDLLALAKMIDAGLNGLTGIVDAKPGDKTLVDTLTPARDSLMESLKTGKDFIPALEDYKAAAALGRDSTLDMIAIHGRASRLGERSRGVLDAGAVSCCIILCAMADGIISQLCNEPC